MSSALITSALSLPADERINLMQALLTSLKASAPTTPVKAAKPAKTPAAPKKAAADDDDDDGVFARRAATQ